MILHGEADRLVPHAQGELLYSMLSDACHDTIFVSLPTAGHGPAWDFLGDDTVREGATIRSTSRSDCFPTEPTIYSPDMDTVIDFFKQNLVNI